MQTHDMQATGEHKGEQLPELLDSPHWALLASTAAKGSWTFPPVNLCWDFIISFKLVCLVCTFCVPTARSSYMGHPVHEYTDGETPPR